jgi:gliding motility-associated protein GldM
MINMMYLVLMALLALNVSKEILKAFHLIEVSFNKSQANLDAKNVNIMKAFKEAAGNRPEVVPFYNRALKAQQIADSFVSYIQKIKDDLIKRTDGRAKPEKGEPSGDMELIQADNIERHAHYFFKDPKDARARDLQNRVNKTRNDLIALLKDTNDKVHVGLSLIKDIESRSDLRAENEPGRTQTWASVYFEHSPLAGVITMLTKIQNDTKNTESAVINALSAGIDEGKVSFDVLTAAVIAPSSTVMVGEKYKAQVLLVASNSKSEHEILVGGRKLEMIDGKGIYEVTPSSQGVVKWDGVINVATDKGVVPYKFEAEYQAFQGQATISATAMNVLYIGIPNPISISVPGFAPKDITPSMVGGSLVSDGRGNYNANLTAGRDATIMATAKMRDGSSRKMGEMKYRVRNLPKPEAKWGLQESGRPCPKEALISQNSMVASMGEGFAFEGIKFTVTRYQFIFVPRKMDAVLLQGNGAAITPQMKAALQSAKKGDKLIVDKIYAKGPDGKEKALLPLFIEII